ncbi:MAG: hypothetical protein ACE148_01570 [Vicinamibacterales bacterium]
MTPAAHHLPDERLVACSLVEGDPACQTPAEAAAFAHMAACDKCSMRYGKLRQLLDGVRAEDCEHFDSLFPPERLEAHRAQIMRRLEALSRPAKVLRFPLRRSAQARPRESTPARPARWAAVAAAAGVVLGLSLGWYAGLPFPRSPGASPVTVADSRPAPTIEPAPGASVKDGDEELLADIADALSRQRADELAAFDAFTPRMREVAAVTK